MTWGIPTFSWLYFLAFFWQNSYLPLPPLLNEALFMTCIRMAIQKSGRLADHSLALLRHCGFDIESIHSSLLYKVKDFPLELLRVRDDDIPELLDKGACELGIVGNNILLEQSLERQKTHWLPTVRTLNFGHCRLSIAVPNTFSYEAPRSLAGCRIATEYPHLTQQFLKQHQVTADIVELSGSIEIAPRLDIADVICDL